jgi:transposase-like protein
MIRTSQVHHYRVCGSTHIVKNGRNRSGSQQYQCRTCGASKVLIPKQRYSEERKAEVLRAYQERCSLQGLSRTFGITQWLKKTPEPAHRQVNPVRGQGQ